MAAPYGPPIPPIPWATTTRANFANAVEPVTFPQTRVDHSEVAFDYLVGARAGTGNVSRSSGPLRRRDRSPIRSRYERQRGWCDFSRSVPPAEPMCLARGVLLDLLSGSKK